jgi:hypothetical protein
MHPDIDWASSFRHCAHLRCPLWHPDCFTQLGSRSPEEQSSNLTLRARVIGYLTRDVPSSTSDHWYPRGYGGCLQECEQCSKPRIFTRRHGARELLEGSTPSSLRTEDLKSLYQEGGIILAPSASQFTMVRSLNELGEHKYPVHIHRHWHSHAAIIVRNTSQGSKRRELLFVTGWRMDSFGSCKSRHAPGSRNLHFRFEISKYLDSSGRIQKLVRESTY